MNNGITITQPITIKVKANRLYELGLKYIGLQKPNPDDDITINFENHTFTVSEEALQNSGWVRQ